MSNILIKASAGTGKTFALATEAIGLLLSDERPREFVGLTFSRAAAGEIFNRIANRLAKAAASVAGAQEETRHLLAPGEANDSERRVWVERVWQEWGKRGMVATGEGGEPYLVPALFAQLLRSYIHEQHVSRIGTIDSFMAQFVNAFPMELGLEGGMTIMEPYEIKQQWRAAVDGLLQESGAGDVAGLLDEFSQATLRESTKLYSNSLDRFVAESLELMQAWPHAGQWGDPKTIWGTAGVPYGTVTGSLEEVAAEIEEKIIASLPANLDLASPKGWPLVAEAVRNYNGSYSTLPTPLKNLFSAWDGGAAIDEFNFNGKKRQLTPSAEAVVARVLAVLVRETFQIRCRQTAGRYQLIKRIADNYDRETRRRGRLTFGDIPRLIAELGSVERLNLEYRFDAQLKHWALDEFQDTSRLQWETISNLIDEVRSDEARRLFIVGDMKQAIYGWRGGDVGIFNEEAESGYYREMDLVQSYRYGPQIAAVVNTVFDGESIARWLEGYVVAAEGEKWRSLWRKHEAARAVDDYVKVELVEAGRYELEPFATAIANELLQVCPWERGITTGILVERNSEGEELVEALRARGIPAVWEGESSIADTPVVEALLNLLHFAEHPADGICWGHLCATPLFARPPFAALYQGRNDEVGKSRIARRVVSDVTRLGLARTLREYALQHATSFDDFTSARIDSLVTAAISYSALAAADMTLSDFREYVESFTERAAAESTTVRILTVHRSKGLGFDYVIAPFTDSGEIAAVSAQGTFVAPDGRWLLDRRPSREIIQYDDVLLAADSAERGRRAYDVLCRYYVAMTRAKRALSVYLGHNNGKGGTYAFVNYMAQQLGKLPFAAGSRNWYAEARRAEAVPAVVAERSVARRRRKRVVRATPSLQAHSHVSAAMLFRGEDTGARRGTEIHDLLQRLEWLDGSSAALEIVAQCGELGVDLVSDSPLRRALERVEGVVELWRERSFEVMVDGAWLSGIFDRVVLRRDASGRLKGDIYDYKSNRRREGESEAGFEARMRETYSGQMQTYRRALSRLTSVAPEDITTTLLLTEGARG